MTPAWANKPSDHGCRQAIIRHGGIASLLIAASVLSFRPCADGEFLNWDDDRNFVENPAYRGVGWDQARWAWSTYHLGVWQPLAWLILGVQYAGGGMDPRVYHATSLTLHALNALVVYVLALALLRRVRPAGVAEPGMRFGAWAAAMLFAVHPLRAEAVCWISCQPYLPACLLSLLSVWAYLRAHPSDGVTRVTWLGACFALFAAAVACKAVALTLPFVLLVLDWFPLRRFRMDGSSARRAPWILLEKLPFLIVASLAAAWALAAKDYNESRVPLREFDATVRLAQSAWGLVFYLWKSVAPFELIAYYRLPGDVSLASPRYAACALGLLAAVVALAMVRRTRAPLVAAALIYAIVLLPNLGLMQISQQLAADRYSYLAMIAPMVLVGAMLAKAWGGDSRRAGPRRVILAALVALAAAGLSGLSRVQARMWRDSRSLWSAVLAIDPRCAVAHCNLGEALLTKGEFADASTHLSRAIDLDDSLAFAYTNLGALLCQARRFGDAAICGEKALAIEPGLRGKDRARTHAMLGQSYAGLRRDELAWRHTRTAQRMGLPEADKMIEYLSSISTEPAQSREVAPSVTGGGSQDGKTPP